jgi:signal peptidase I
MALDPERHARLDAVAAQERARAESRRVWVWRERTTLLALLALALICMVNFRMARVVGESMEPSLKQGQSLVVWKSYGRFAPLKPGDIVVFEQDGEELVKRVVFVQNAAGTATWPAANHVVPADPRLNVTPDFFPDYAHGAVRAASASGQPRRSVYVLGDNLELSDDSRDFGPIAPESILGKVIYAR